MHRWTKRILKGWRLAGAWHVIYKQRSTSSCSQVSPDPQLNERTGWASKWKFMAYHHYASPPPPSPSLPTPPPPCSPLIGVFCWGILVLAVALKLGYAGCERPPPKLNGWIMGTFKKATRRSQALNKARKVPFADLGDPSFKIKTLYNAKSFFFQIKSPCYLLAPTSCLNRPPLLQKNDIRSKSKKRYGLFGIESEGWTKGSKSEALDKIKESPKCSSNNLPFEPCVLG